MRGVSAPRSCFETYLGAALVAALVFGGQLLDPGNAARIGGLYTICVVVLAIRCDATAALTMAAAGIGLDVISEQLSAGVAEPLSHWPRAIVLVTLALLTSGLSNRTRQALAQSQWSEERFRRAFDDSHVGMTLVALEGEHAGKITEANAALGRLLRYDIDELVGHLTIAEFVPPEDAPAIAKDMARLQSGEIPVLHRRMQVVLPDGSRRWTQLTSSMIRDATGKPIYRLSQVEDVEAQHRAEEQLRWYADHDSLTDLPNRRRFSRELKAELAGRSRGAVVLCDLDGFKDVNDSLGHAAGDHVLASVARLLRDALRTADVVARVGGDEFGILLRRIEASEVDALLAKLVAQVDAGLALERAAGDPVVTISAGAAAFGAEDRDPDALLHAADRAMYAVKRRSAERRPASPA